jgi:chloramphenicol 3-O phosphotransferase
MSPVAPRLRDAPVPAPVLRWQEAVHTPGIYDMEVDTSRLSPEACAALIREHLDSGPGPTAFPRLAALATTHG